MNFSDKRLLYAGKFSLGYLNTDINTKFALISLIGYLYSKIHPKKPNITYLDIIKQINNKGKCNLTDVIMEGLAIVCEDFAYGCKEFPTFGLQDKEIPNKIKSILQMYLPF